MADGECLLRRVFRKLGVEDFRDEIVQAAMAGGGDLRNVDDGDVEFLLPDGKRGVLGKDFDGNVVFSCFRRQFGGVHAALELLP